MQPTPVSTPVRQVMTKDVISISPDLGVDVALEIMAANDIRRLPVLSSSGRLIGIITRYDAMLAMPRDTDAYTAAERGEIPKVREVMTDYVYTVSPEDSVAQAAHIMLHQNVGALPVVEDKEVIGIITESDLFKFLAHELHLDEPQAG